MKILISEKLSEHKYKTPEGYLVCVDSILARTGKQTYRRNELFHDGDDTEVEVDRTPEEVFSEATLASFENKPVTVEHPDEDVNINNYKEYAVGFVRDVKRGEVDGQDVILGTLVITDAQTIEEIENGEHTELSCGYDCDILDEDNPTQRNIRGNHVALCEQGRAGIARIVDSVKDAMYCVEFSENGQVFKTWIEARDEKEAQVFVLHSNPKAKIRNVYRDSVDDANRLPKKDRQFISNYLRMISTFTSRDVDIRDLLRPLSGHGFNYTIEKVEGWKWNKGEMAYKDYYVNINGYDDRFLVTLYADPKQDWKVKEVNAYFTDSIDDSINDVSKSLAGKILGPIAAKYHAKLRYKVYNGALTAYFKPLDKNVKSWEFARAIISELEPRGWSWGMWDNGEWSMHNDQVRWTDAVTDSRYKCEFKLNGDTMWTYVNADSPEDAKRELLDKFASAKNISVTGHDSVEDSYNWKQLIEKNKFNLTYQYETGGFKVPLKLSKNNAKYDIEENFNIKNYTEQDVREYQRAWEEFARKYRGKDSVEDTINDDARLVKERNVTRRDVEQIIMLTSSHGMIVLGYGERSVYCQIIRSSSGSYEINVGYSSYDNGRMKTFKTWKFSTFKEASNKTQEIADYMNRLYTSARDSVEDDSKRYVNKKVYKNAYDKAKNYADFCNIELTITTKGSEVYEVELYGYRSDIDNWERLMKNQAYDSVSDASRGHEIVVYAENYLSKLGKNNSVGKYDKIIFGVKSLLEKGFLQGEDLRRAVEREVDRLLKQHGLDSAIKVVNMIKAKDKTVKDGSVELKYDIDYLTEKQRKFLKLCEDENIIMKQSVLSPYQFYVVKGKRDISRCASRAGIIITKVDQYNIRISGR